jgi:hypothetical protein
LLIWKRNREVSTSRKTHCIRLDMEGRLYNLLAVLLMCTVVATVSGRSVLDNDEEPASDPIVANFDRVVDDYANKPIDSSRLNSRKRNIGECSWCCAGYRVCFSSSRSFSYIQTEIINRKKYCMVNVDGGLAGGQWSVSSCVNESRDWLRNQGYPSGSYFLTNGNLGLTTTVYV